MKLRRFGVVVTVCSAPVWVGCTSILGGDFSDGPLTDAAVTHGDASVPADAGQKDARVGPHDARPIVDALKDALSHHDTGGEAGKDGASPTDTGADSQSETGSCASGVVCSGVCELDTDVTNCGSCDHRCVVGTCGAGACQPAIIVDTGPFKTIVDIASDGKAVMWGESSSSTINYVASVGAATVVLADSSIVVGPVSVSLAGGFADWTQFSGGQTTQGIAVPGQASSGALNSEMLGAASKGLVGDAMGMNVYTLDATGSYNNVIRWPAGTDNEAYYDYQETSTAGGSNLAVDAPGNYVVFGDVGGAQVIVFSTATITALGVSGFPNAQWVATDGTNAYWGADLPDGTHPIAGAPLASPQSPFTVLADTGAAITGIATDGKNVFFIANNVIEYVPVTGGTMKKLASVANPQHLKAAGRGVFFDDNERIWEVTAP